MDFSTGSTSCELVGQLQALCKGCKSIGGARCAGQLHGFVSMAGVVDRAAVALREISAALAKALQVPAAQNAALAAEA